MIYSFGESLLDIIVNTDNVTVANPDDAMLNTAVSLGRSNDEYMKSKRFRSAKFSNYDKVEVGYNP